MAGLTPKNEDIIVRTSKDGLVRKTIRGWFSGHPRKRFVIPLFQRRYLWGHKQCKRLFEDALKCGVNLGMVMVYFNSDNELIIVDGQQRATTIMLLLASLRKRGADVGDVLVYKGTPTLQLTYHDKEPFTAVIENKKPVGASHVIQTAMWFDSWTSTLTKYDIDKMTDNLLDRFTILEFTAPQEDDAENLQVVYERLAIRSVGMSRLLFNATPGISNGVMDLTRNLVLSYYDDRKAIEIYHSHWMPLEILVAQNDAVYSQEAENRFILHLKKYLESKNLEISSNPVHGTMEVYNVFKRYLHSEKCSENSDKVTFFVKELLNL